LFFNRKPKRQPDALTVDAVTLPGIAGDVPVIRIGGLVPPGSAGNVVVAECFGHLSQVVDIQSSPRRLLVYDMTDLQYDFGDHLGAFLWNLPALLDGVAVMVAATGKTRRNLVSLQQFIGPWIPLGFYDSVDAISTDVRERTEALQVLSDKRDACVQRGQVIMPSDTGVNVVLLGSSQVGRQYRTGRTCRDDSDLDCGVVGGPRELALLTVKMRSPSLLMPNVEHPPIKAYSSTEEATNQGLFVVMPRNNPNAEQR
jgi:hypothetical protein